MALTSFSTARISEELTEAYRKLQTAEVFTGLVKTYQPKDDDGQQYPPESVHVRADTKDVLKTVARQFTKMIDTELTKDVGNVEAKGTIKVNDKPILEDCPVPFLLYMEKQLSDLHTVFSQLPTLDAVEEWTWDPEGLVYRSDERLTNRTQKVETPKIVAEPTEHHPAQVHIFTKDEIVGQWRTQKLSKGVTEKRRRQLMENCNTLLRAVKSARERANSVEVQKKRAGKILFDVLFADDTNEASS